MKEAILMVKDFFHQYFDGGSYLILFLAALLYIFLHRREEEKSVKIFFWYALLLGVIIINPIVYKLLEPIFTGNVYWRMFWMLPIAIIIPYVVTQIIVKCKESVVEKIIITISLIIIIVLSGKMVFNKENFQETTNWYKLPQDALDVAYLISQDDASYKIALVPETIVSYIRQYDSSIYLVSPRNPHSYEGDEMIQALYRGQVDKIIKNAEIEGTNYIVFRNETELIGSMEENGFEVMAKTKVYTIYKRK